MTDASHIAAADAATIAVGQHWDAIAEHVAVAPVTASFGFLHPDAVTAMLESIQRHATEALAIMKATKWPTAQERAAIRGRAARVA
jgi:hypothetical protein